jgi:hypothetical protein
MSLHWATSDRITSPRVSLVRALSGSLCAPDVNGRDRRWKVSKVGLPLEFLAAAAFGMPENDEERTI